MKIILFILFLNLSIIAQVSTSSSGARNIQPEKTDKEKINQILTDSGNLFKEGLMNLQDNRRPQAREKFDKSVEVFMASSYAIFSNTRLTGCYYLLVETVYRIEFPSSNKQPQIKGLSLGCGWNIDNGLADSVAKLTLSAPKAATTANLSDKEKEQIQAITGNPTADIPQTGFSEQRFEPSPLDELSKLELTPEEQNIANIPIKRTEYRKVILHSGTKPTQSADGKVGIVMAYFNEVLHDPYSQRFVRWTKLAVHYSCRDGNPCWRVGVKYRAKNTFGAYVLTDETFDIRNNKIISRYEGILSAIAPANEDRLQNVANRTGIPVEQLQAVNGGTLPKDGKIVVPTNSDKRITLVRASTASVNKGIQLVKAQSGDTVAKIAARFGVPAIEVAKFNGLSNDVNSPLPVGREIRIPAR